MSRRETLFRLGRGLGLSMLAALGLGAQSTQPCGQCCAIACGNLDDPPRGPEMGECMRGCMESGIARGPGGVSTACETVCL